MLAGVIGGAIKLFMRDAYVDREQQMALLQGSDLDWVAIRLPRRLMTRPAATSWAFPILLPAWPRRWRPGCGDARSTQR